MKHLLYIIVSLLLLSGCMSVEKATSYLRSKNKLAEVCYENYPIKESIVIDTVITEKQIIIPGDSIPCPETTHPTTGRKYTPKVKCPDISYYERTITAKEKRIQEATSGIEMYKQKYFEEQAAHAKTKGELKTTAAELAEMKRYKLYFFLAIGTGIFVLLLPVLKRFLPVPFS